MHFVKNNITVMIDDFFEQEEDEELEEEEKEENELVFQYEDMVNNGHSMYLSLDDCESLFTYYTRFYDLVTRKEDINMEMAAMVINDAITQYPDATSIQLFYIFYRRLNKELSHKEAVKQLKSISFQQYEQKEQSYRLATIYAKMDANIEAISSFKELLKHSQSDKEKEDIYVTLLFLFDQKEDIDEMIDCCEKLRNINLRREQSTLWQLFVHFLPNVELGILFYEAYTQRNPLYYPSWAYLGDFYSFANLYEKSAEAFENVVALSDESSALVSLGGAYNSLGQKEKALECYHEILSRFPERVDVYLDLADTYYSMGEVETALRYYSLAIEAFPEDIPAYMGMAITLASLEQYDEAISYLKRAPRKGHMSLDLALLLSDYLIETEQDKEAIEILEYLLKTYPLNIDVWLSYSNYYAIIGDFSQACDVLKRALVTLPDNAELMYRMANYYVLDGKNERAISFLMSAYMLDATSLDTFLNYDEDIMKNPVIVDVVNDLKSKKK